jgi:hypothetical protein
MLRLFRLFIFVWLTAVGDLYAQSGNPFDLAFRLPEAASVDISTVTGNPFDVAPHRPPGAAKALMEEMPAARRPLLSLPAGDNLSARALFFILLTVLAFLAFTVAINRNAALKAWKSFLTDNALVIAQRESTGQAGNTPYYLLYGNFLLNAGLFIYLIVQSQTDNRYNNTGFLLLCIAVAIAIFLSKHLLLRLISWLLPVEQEMTRYNFLITVFNCVLGLFLLPFNFLISFLLEYKDFLVFWAIGLAILFYGYRTLRAATLATKFLAGHQFHFLLYLCTVEIAPVVILIKLVLLQMQ